MLLISSEEPLEQVFHSTPPSNRGRTSRSILSFFRIKYTTGSNPPTAWLIIVARAAPATPQRSPPTSSASSAALVSPAPTVIYRPSFGFSAATKKLWKTFCKIKQGLAARMIRAYSTQFSSISPSAPSAAAMGRAKTAPSAPTSAPHTAAAQTRKEKYRLASSGLSSPMVFATMAEPPVPIMNPGAPVTISSGMIRFTAAKAVFPAKLDTNTPSTTL